MRRAVVAVVLAAACTSGHPSRTADLTALRQAAALAPCPTGVGAVPHLVLHCLGGGPDVTLDAAAPGTPMLVNVYASWCGPCKSEMPVLAAFAQRAGAKVALVGVDTEDDPRLALLFARDLHQHWAAVEDDDGRFLRHYSSGPPVTLFVQAGGAVAYVHRGAFASVEDVVAEVRRRLGVSV